MLGMPTLFDKISVLSGMGPKAREALYRLDVKTVRDLLFYFPFRYEDYSRVKRVGELVPGETVTVHVTIDKIHARPSHRSSVKVTEALVSDDTGSLTVKWFNQPFLVKTLAHGRRVALSGHVDERAELVLVNPRYEILGEEEPVHTGRIVPIYPRSGVVGEKRLRTAIKEALGALAGLPEILPASIVEAETFPSLPDAVQAIHFPRSEGELQRAADRLKFDELFLHQLLFGKVKEARKEHEAFAFPINEAHLKGFAERLPFALTPGQKRSAWEIVQDLAKSHPMNRLLEGDVGSGKTVVAAMALSVVLAGEKQAIYLAPDTAALLTKADCLLGGESLSRDELRERISSGQPTLVVGTHAVLEENWVLPNLALVVVDEQHRFGVRQRHQLLSRGEMVPHLLSMSATPIPRSLALTVYGDLDLSIIPERPKGRKPIATYCVDDAQETQMFQQIRDEIDGGGRVYVVCPLIDPSDTLGAASVSDVAQRLRRTHFKDIPVAELHGRVKSKEKEEIMRSFKSGNAPVLVSTTVIEVGVDVPEATVMVIEGAERFGLAQLHQLRGRVGRSDKASFCFLRPSGSLMGTARERLDAFVKCQNGFELAEMDLRFRGPGNVFGSAQSGFPDFQLATLGDVLLMKKARDWAGKTLQDDPFLEGHPTIRDQVQEELEDLHLE